MFYVIRGTDGRIHSLSREPQTDREAMNENDPEIQQFLGVTAAMPTFNAVDAEFVRVIEDLIDTLISKNLIRHTDLPEAAQKKLLLRKGLRSRVNGALDLFGREENFL